MKRLYTPAKSTQQYFSTRAYVRIRLRKYYCISLAAAALQASFTPIYFSLADTESFFFFLKKTLKCFFFFLSHHNTFI